MLHSDKQELASQIAKKLRWVKRNYRVSDGPRWLKRLYFRIGKPFLRLNYSVFKWFNPDTPWTSPASIAFFNAGLDRTMTGFEFGSGISTLYFAKRLKELVSIEHDTSWHKQIQERLMAAGITNVTYVLREPHIKDGEVEEDVWLDGQVLHHGFSAAFHDYSSFICQYPDSNFDFVLVDGRARVDCVLRSIPKLKAGGILVLDNSERERYKQVFKILESWPKISTTTGITDTTIWFKPAPAKSTT